MAGTVSVTLRIPAELCNRLDNLGKNTDRTRSWLITKALKQYLDEAEQEVSDVIEGIRAADAGDLISGEEVGRMIQAIANIRALRGRNGKVTVEELLSARDEGRKY